MRAFSIAFVIVAACGCGNRYEYQPSGYTLQAAGCAGDGGTPIERCPGDGRAVACEPGSANCYVGDQCAGAQLFSCQQVSDGSSGGGECDGCARSRAQYKKDIQVLRDDELVTYRDDLLTLPLATWRYVDEGSGAKQRLGYMLDEAEGMVSSDVRRGQVDLYSYTSMTVAALKVQQREIEELKKQLEELKGRLGSCAQK